MEITESNVVHQIKKKNEKALVFVIHQYGGLLHAIITRHIHGRTQDYEECLDDVLLSIWNHIDSYDANKNSFKQWVAAIAKYKAIDYQRKYVLQQTRYHEGEITDNLIQTKIETSIPEVDELLEELSDSERLVFTKYYLEGTPAKEIATQFDAKESWVHNKLSRGRKKLRTLFVHHFKA
ncbi:sigma-70 family RNA polymerase sigma factor [Bacillus alkalicellulosilyticus]|uniref:sigma-70 family RNA polymerase sigma factor n=1 Tax=Alkalihalobacterium alkalicellulosilyticum TaxID=1912214 RepID=UPI000996C5A5|nr:sigma-70 family RNA polymerase sigma factor [Bacillus alkalicellulosilyticus]